MTPSTSSAKSTRMGLDVISPVLIGRLAAIFRAL
jgi:hypothetical protein